MEELCLGFAVHFIAFIADGMRVCKSKQVSLTVFCLWFIDVHHRAVL